jgi:hypothetical protein
MKRLFLSMVLLVVSWPAFAIDLGGVEIFRPEIRKALEQKYNDMPKPKILLSSYLGQPYFFTTQNPIWTAEDIRKAGLERCEMLNNAPCTIVAVDDDLQDYSKPVIAPIRVLGKTDYSDIPTVLPRTKTNQFGAFMASTGHRAIALDLQGGWGASWDSDTPQSAARSALDQCGKTTGTGKPCFLYDVDGEINPEMTKRIVINDIAVLDPDLASVPSPPSPCKPFLWVKEGESCVVQATATSDQQIQPRTFAVASQTSQRLYVAILMLPPANNKGEGLPAMAKGNAEEMMGKMAGVSQNGSGEAVTMGDVIYKRYSTRGLACVGIFRYGTPMAQGYSSYLVGSECEYWLRGTLTENQISDFIASITVKD